MILGRVVGSVVSTAKHPTLGGQKLLLIQPDEGYAQAREILAIDGVGAGTGERVLVVLEGRAAGSILGDPRGPVDAAVVAIVDRVDVEAAER